MRLLYISPVVPSLTGNGLAMRAGAVLEALASHHSVSLLVNPLYPPRGPVPEYFARMCREVVVGADGYRRQRFDVVHIFRLASLPTAQPILKRGWFQGLLHGNAQRHLDLDDIESQTHQRLAALCSQNRHLHLARMEEAWAAQSAGTEAEVFAAFDRIYVCSRGDRDKVAKRCAAGVYVLPNVVHMPAEAPPRPREGTFLFIGTLGYYPNADACRYLRREIVPMLDGIQIQIVGTGATDELRAAISHPAIELVGEVPEVAPWYHRACAVVVPLWAGGGTRIKILEAFSYRRPVITTSVGMEGIDARHEQHLLVADTPEDFTRACLRIQNDPEFGDRLADRAFELVTERYSSGALRKTIAELSWPE